MGHNRSYLFIHSSEWNRLKNQGALTKKPPEKNCYIESLIAQSQEWIKSWPDTVEGHVALVEKQKEQQHAKDIEKVKLFEMQKKHVRKTEAIEKARKMIFDDSCYGSRLISALIESKTLEERDVQVEFQKKLKLNSAAAKQIENGCILNYSNPESTEKELQLQKRQKDKEVALFNKAIYNSQTEEKKQETEKERQLELEDLRIVKKLIEKQNAKKENCKAQIKQDLEHYETERRIKKERKLETEKRDELIAEAWKKYENRKECRMKMMGKKSIDNPRFEKHYEMIRKLKNDEERCYDEFVNKAINVQDSRVLKQEQEEKIKEEKKHKARLTQVQTNKKLAETKRLMETNQNKCVCERQSIITKSDKKRKIKEVCKQRTEPPTFLTKSSKLIRKLRQREQEPTPWNNLNAAHAQFAQQANETLKECRYKNFARKVVDDYRRLNCLDSHTLPVSNY